MSCPYCGRDNPPGIGTCPGCGGISDGLSSQRPVEYRPFHPNPPASYHQGSNRSDFPLRASGCLVPGGGCLRAGSFGCAVVLGLIVLIGGIGVYWFLQRTHDEVLTVTGRSWERTVEIERLERVTEEAWEGHVPSGARRMTSWSETSTTERIRTGTQRVKVGVRDTGNGYSEDVFEDRPVYEERPVTRTKVRYEIDRWRHDRTLRETGSDPSPRWPEVHLNLQEREKSRREILQVQLRNDSGADRTYTANGLDVWLGFEAGQKVQAKVNRLGTVTELLKTN